MVTRKQIFKSSVVDRHTRPARASEAFTPRPGRATSATDDELERLIRARLDELGASAARTVAVRVADGRATAAGLVGSREQLDEVERAVRAVPGVKGYCNLAVIDGHGARRAQQAAEALSNLFTFECSRSDVDVTVFGHTAVVSGEVPSADDRFALEALAMSYRGIDDVVNRTAVASAGGER